MPIQQQCTVIVIVLQSSSSDLSGAAAAAALQAMSHLPDVHLRCCSLCCCCVLPDIANAVLDGVDGILLGAETLRGIFPVEVVGTIAQICRCVLQTG